MISTAFSSDSMSWLVGEFLISIVAMLGGIMVFRGLWIEKKADKEAFLNVDDFRSSKLKSKRGWNMLMWGIAIETAVAGVFAAKDGWEIRQIKINEAKIDARTQDRTITDAQRNRFILLTKDYPKIPVRVFVQLEDNETFNYAQDIRYMLNEAGYNAKNNEGVVEIGRGHVQFRNRAKSSSANVFTISYGTNNRVDQMIPIFGFGITNGKPVLSETNDFATFAVFTLAIRQIGLIQETFMDSQMLNPGEFGIVIPEKSH